MAFTKPVFLLLIVILLGNAGFVLAETPFPRGVADTVPPQIVNPDTIPVQYCSDSVPVAPRISIQSIVIDEADEGMKVSIANYKRNEDILVWDEVHSFVYTWNSYYGHLEIKGKGSESEYEDAIAKVYYKNIAEKPVLGVRSFSISLTDADYLPATTHFYRYVTQLDITWKEAKAAADTMQYYGLQGYLTTITSKTENDFIWTKIDGVGWIGASDDAEEGKWEWVTGPEAGTHFWQGNQTGYAVSGRYNFWNSGEPNNQGGEDFAHINANPNTIPKSWNDLPNQTNPNAQYYRAQGFIVEFGGYDTDPPVKLSATASIEVAKIAFSDVREFEICQGESQQLNLVADDTYSYTWTPYSNISDPNISNPVVYPMATTFYKAVGKLDFCTDTADFKVIVNPLPLSLLPSDTVYCKGDSITLDPGVHSSYLWSNGANTRTITVADEAKYWVKLSNDVSCAIVDSVDVKWSVRPELDYSTVDTLVCGKKNQVLDIKFISGEADTRLIAIDPVNSTVSDPTSSTPTITVSKYGKYYFEMQITDRYGCYFLDTLNIEFHNQPVAIIDMDENKCKGYSLDLSFGGVTKEDALFTWYYNDTVYQAEVGLNSIIIPLGYGELDRTVGLTVNEQGCFDSVTEPVTVTPNVTIDTDIDEGCTPLNVAFSSVATEAIDNYFWDLGNGESSTVLNPSTTYINDTIVDINFDVALTVRSTEDCENTGIYNDMITVHPIPTVDLSFNEDDCNSEQMEIWYVGSASASDSFYWDLSSLLPAEIIVDPGITNDTLEIKRSSEPTAVISIHVVSEFGCKSGTISKLWKRKPVFEVIVDTTEGCPPLAVFANALVLDSVDKVSFNYDLGDGTSGAGDFVEHIYTSPNAKNIIQFGGTSSITNCAETVVYADSVFVYPVPLARFTPVPEAVVISDPEILFENSTTGADIYDWEFGDGASSTEYSPTHRYPDMGFYNVNLFTYNYLGCLDSTSTRVVVAFDKLFPPNAFSPNATEEEDREFRIYSEGVADDGYQLLIFNRWGEITFESNSQEIGWNGKMRNNNFAPAGVYTWVLQYLDFRGETHKQQGTVTLIF